MSDRLAELRRSVEELPAGFDWDDAAWSAAGQRLLKAVVAASTEWENLLPNTRMTR